MTVNNGLYKNDVTIASGSATSGAVATSGGVLAGVYYPASMTGTSLTFEAAMMDSPNTFVPIRDQFGALVSLTLNAAASYGNLKNALPFGPDFIRAVSSASEGSNRTLTLVFQQVV